MDSNALKKAFNKRFPACLTSGMNGKNIYANPGSGWSSKFCTASAVFPRINCKSQKEQVTFDMIRAIVVGWLVRHEVNPYSVASMVKWTNGRITRITTATIRLPLLI